MPSFIRQDPLRESECAVYDLLKCQLDDKFTVYYSRYWFGLGLDGSEKDGEADFIIVHETFGPLTLEVKGGGISYDPATSRWESLDPGRFGTRLKIHFNRQGFASTGFWNSYAIPRPLLSCSYVPGTQWCFLTRSR